VRYGLFALTVAATTCAVTAAAEEGRTENIRLDYVATAGCPSEQEFETRVRARTVRVQFAPNGAGARVFDVRLEQGPPATGRVTVRRAQSSEGTRSVRADTCADVADALALVVALAVDPAALMAPAPPSPPHAAESPPPSIDIAAPSPSPSPTAEPPTAEPPSASPPVPRPETAPMPSTQARHREVYLGTDLAVATGTAPTTLVGASPYVGWASSTASTLAPSARIGFVHATTGAIDVPGGAAVFAWSVGRLDGCATAWANRPARLSTCVHLEGGSLEATGVHVPAPRAQSRAWLGVGPLLRGEWSFASPLFVEAEVAAMAHVIADRFLFLPDTTAYQVPRAGVFGSIGLGVFFL
jgi:hypothetical protein